MALFARDRDVVPAAGMPVSGVAREEIMMGERERSMSQPTSPGGIDAFLGKGTRVTGKLVFEGTGRIEGQVDGEISAQDTLIVGAGALVKASIVGTIVIIEGRVTGDVTAHQRLELRAASRVQGNISSPSLVVQEGAFFEGQCSMAAAETNATRDKTDPAGPLRRARDNVATTTATATAAVAAQS